MTLSNLKKENWDHFKLKEGEKIFLCKKCLTLSTRPRTQFTDGVCNACKWSEMKRNSIDWKSRWKQLEKVCKQYRRKDGFDVIAPSSGGKDSSYVIWMLKGKLGMHPLSVTFAPPIPTEEGKRNFENFKKAGYDNILVSPNPEVYRKLNRKGFIEQGRPKMAFETGVRLVGPIIAAKMGIPFIVYGEEGEQEYGGSMSQLGKYKMDRDYIINHLFSGYDTKEYLDEFSKLDLFWWTVPKAKELKNLYATNWSHFENWDPKPHYEIAKKHFGFGELKENSIGTFTNYAQLDDKLQDLHAYMMQIKFGFGRAWSDACIEIRAGRMTREEGIRLAKAYDGTFPDKYLEIYLDYFQMNEKEFFRVIDSFRSPDIWKKVDGKWVLRFAIE